MPVDLRKLQITRRYSWPPLKLIKPRREKDIDEDPFSHFLTPINYDHARAWDDYMEADIERESRPKSLSPCTMQNRDKVLQGPAIRKLKSWIQRMEARYVYRRTPDTMIEEEASLPTPPNSPVQLQSSINKRVAFVEMETGPNFDMCNITISPPLRGRRPARSTRRRYGDKVVRSHSKRARVWKEPDEDIWSVPEEQEDIGLGIKF